MVASGLPAVERVDRGNTPLPNTTLHYERWDADGRCAAGAWRWKSIAKPESPPHPPNAAHAAHYAAGGAARAQHSPGVNSPAWLANPVLSEEKGSEINY